MKTTRKIILVFALALVFIATLAVTAFAAFPAGVKSGETGWVESTYDDIDTEDGWVLYAIGNSATNPLVRVQTGAEATTLVNAPGGANFYYNKTLKKGVIITFGSLAGDHNDQGQIYRSAFTKSIPAAYFIVDKWDSIVTHFESSDAVWSSRIQGTGYPTSLDGTGSGGTWTYVYVQKSDYELMKTEFATIDADTTTTDDAKKNAKATVAANYSSFYQNKNVAEEGALWTLGYLFVLMSNDTESYPFDSLEFRVKDGASGSFQNFGFVLQNADTVKSIYIDSKITYLAPQSFSDGTRAIFKGLKGLTSLGHVVYEDYSGAYNLEAEGSTFESGKVNVSGFTTTDASTKSGIFMGSTSITDAVWYNSFTDTKTPADLSGEIDILAFSGCTSLKTVTLTAPLTAIKTNAFQKCTALTTIDLKGGVGESVSIDSTAFASTTQEITVYVYSTDDATKATAAFAPFSNVKVENLNPSYMGEAITADGYSIRINDNTATYKGPALRAEFTLLKSKVDTVKSNEGYDLADYGVVVFSEKTLTSYGSVDAIYAAIQAGLDETAQKKIKVVSAASGPYVKVHENGDITFAAAITGIPEANYDSAVYTYAYTAWSNGTETKYSYITYTSSRVAGKQAHSLYDATVYAFANGIVNSQNFTMSTNVDLWDILSVGAFSITDGEQSGVKSYADSVTLDVQYTFDENNKFTYLDLPLYAWNYYKSSATGSTAWNSRAHSLEATSSTNVNWSILRDGDDLIVVYRAKDEATDAVLPELRDRSYGGFAPYSSNYMTPGWAWVTAENANVAQVTDKALVYGDTTTNYFCSTQKIYSPILTEANENKITTIVLDYGIDKISGGAFENTTAASITTIVYPEGVTVGGKLLQYDYYVDTVIYASDNKTSITADTQAAGFGGIADLSGLSGFSLSYAFSEAQKVENVILPTTVNNWSGLEEAFKKAYCIKRVWSVGAAVPADGTVDLTGASGLRSLAKNCFTDMSKYATVTKPTIIMPASFVGVNTYAYQLKEGDACSQVFGADMEFTVVLNNVDALTGSAATANSDYSLMMFYDVLLACGTASRADNFDHLTFVYDLDGNGEIGEGESMSIADWRTYLVSEQLYTPASAS